MQVMVSDTGLYHGNMKQRASESMAFSQFLQAMRLDTTKSTQHWYLAQVREPRCRTEDLAHSWPSEIMALSRRLQPWPHIYKCRHQRCYLVRRVPHHGPFWP